MINKRIPRLAELSQGNYADLPAWRAVNRSADFHPVNCSKDLVRGVHRRLNKVEARWTFPTASLKLLEQVVTVSIGRASIMAHLFGAKWAYQSFTINIGTTGYDIVAGHHIKTLSYLRRVVQSIASLFSCHACLASNEVILIIYSK